MNKSNVLRTTDLGYLSFVEPLKILFSKILMSRNMQPSRIKASILRPKNRPRILVACSLLDSHKLQPKYISLAC
jgi:hypothetical protein